MIDVDQDENMKEESKASRPTSRKSRASRISSKRKSKVSRKSSKPPTVIDDEDKI